VGTRHRTDPSRRRPTRTPRLALAIGLIPLLAACQGGPLGRSDRDFDRRVSLARLRSIDATPLDGARAAPPVPVTDPAGLAAVRERFRDTDRVDLTLEHARASALEHNLDLAVSLIAPTIDAERINEEQGRYEALLFANARFIDADGATALATESNQAKISSVSPGIRVPLRTGGSAEIRAPFTRSRTDNRFALLNPSYTTDLEFSLSHNLLRGAGRKANAYALRVADLGRQQSESRAKLDIIRQLASIDRAYWRLYAASQALDVRARQYELAERQLARARRRFDAGAVAEVEVARAESGLADRLRDIVVAQNAVLLAQRDLKRIMNMPGLDVDSPQHIVAMTDPEPLYYELDPDTLSAGAVEARMELLELELQIAADEAAEALRRNEALPLLAAQFLWRVNGLGGTFNESVRAVRDNNFADWEIGVNAEVPLGNLQRRSAAEQALLSRLQRLASREARRQLVRQEVLDAIDNIDSGWQQILAARQAVALNERTLRAEESLFENGRSTSTDVLDADSRLAEARLRDIQAVVEYQLAQVDLALATGTLLGAARVEWSPVDPRDALRGVTPARPSLVPPGDEQPPASP
jgi:outer membrane protein TolC